ncbi:MAG: DUF4212 domain-containing protein [Candidatus Methanomethyliaceae archaeon]|nr:DUF4212 domain-containing protein [Candidatus Methanomethyliaceae archaeon]MDW7970640.1 DUF4212 domain-containing protein [Nitrososphaerota archaeon]
MSKFPYLKSNLIYIYKKLDYIFVKREKVKYNLQEKNESTPSEGSDEKLRKYWNKLKKITIIWMLAWLFPAVIIHLMSPITSSIKILNGIPLHWFNTSLLSILIGIALIFCYAFVMDRVDRIFKKEEGA